MSQKSGAGRKALVVILVVLAAVVFWAVRDSRVEDELGAVLEGPAVSVDEQPKVPELALLPTDAVEPTRVRVPLMAQGNLRLGEQGTIRGVVLSPSGAQLPGAECSLLADVEDQGFSFARFGHRQAGPPVVSVISDSSGGFELPAPEGYWVLKIAYQGLRTWTEESVPSGSFRRVLMERDRVLVVHVVDAEFRPVVGAEALILEDAYLSHAGARDSGRSNAAGLVKLSLQPGDPWFVKVFHPDYVGTYFEAPPFEGALRIERTVILKRGVRVVGSVLESRSQNALPGATILIDEFGPDPTRTLETDAAGRFDSGPVYAPDIELELTARAPGRAEVRRVVKLQGPELSDGVFEVDFELSAAGIEVTGLVRGEGGADPGDCDVFLRPLAPGTFDDAMKLQSYAVRWRLSGRTDPEGKFRVTGLAAEQAYQLLVVPEEGFSSGLVRVPSMKAGTVHDLGEIEVPRAASLFGSVHHEDGTPAVHLPLYTIRTMHAPWNDSDYFPADSNERLDVYTNQDGEFEFPVVIGGGDYELFWGYKYAPDRIVGRYRPAPGERIGPIEFVLPGAREDERVPLRGIVLDSEDAPVGSVLVEVWDGPKTEVVGEGIVKGQLTEADGTFDITVAASKTYRVTATDLRGRFEQASLESVRPQPGESLWFRLTPGAEPAAELFGVVSDASGTPLVGMAVTLYLSPMLMRCDCLSWSAKTDEHGRFSFGKVAKGRHQVAIVDPSGKLATQMLPATPGEELLVAMEPKVKE